MAHVEHAPAYERLGERKLGLSDVIAQSVGFLGPVFSAAFLIPLLVGLNASSKGGGVAAPVSVIIAAVGILALGWLVSRYAREIHAAGGLYDYVSRGLGERAGVATGILYYAGVLLLSIGLIVLIGGYVHDTLVSEFHHAWLPGWAWSLVVVALLVGILYTGVRISTRAQLALALVSFLAVTAFFISVIIQLGSKNSIVPFKPSSSAQGWSGIFFGVLYGVLLFVGFETAANLGEEAREPRRTIPIAVLASAGIAAVFFVLAAYTQVAGFGFSVKAIESAAAAPLFALGAPKSQGGFGGTWIDRGLELVVLFDMLAVAMGTGVSATRGIFALARDRRLPSPLASVSRSRGTPTGAIAVLAVLALANIAVTVWWPSLFALPNTAHYFAIFAWDSTFGGVALVAVYLLMCVGSFLSFSRRGDGLLLRVVTVIAGILGMAITLGAIFGSVYKVTAPTIYAPYAALGVLVVGVIVAFATKGRTPASLHLEDLAVNPELARLERLGVVDDRGDIVQERHSLASGHDLEAPSGAEEHGTT